MRGCYKLAASMQNDSLNSREMSGIQNRTWYINQVRCTLFSKSCINNYHSHYHCALIREPQLSRNTPVSCGFRSNPRILFGLVKNEFIGVRNGI